MSTREKSPNSSDRVIDRLSAALLCTSIMYRPTKTMQKPFSQSMQVWFQPPPSWDSNTGWGIEHSLAGMVECCGVFDVCFAFPAGVLVQSVESKVCRGHP